MKEITEQNETMSLKKFTYRKQTIQTDYMAYLVDNILSLYVEALEY